MVPPKVWKLLETVDCNDVYEFLGMDRNASLKDLQKAADKKYAKIHNQNSRSDWARAGTKLAGLCKSSIFKDARSKRNYDREAAKRDSNGHQTAEPRRQQAHQPRRREAQQARRRPAQQARRREAQQAGHREAQQARRRQAQQARRREAQQARRRGPHQARHQQAQQARRRRPQQARHRQAQQARRRQASNQAKLKAASFARFVGQHSEAISATGLILILLGAALGGGFGGVLMLGQVAFMCGFTALLNKTSLRQSMIVGAAGISLVVAGAVAVNTPDFPSGWPLNLMYGLRQLGAMALLSGIVSIVYRNSWHINAIGAVRSIAEWWMAKVASWNRLVALGVTAMILSLPVGLVAGFLDMLFGMGGISMMLPSALFWGGGLLLGAHFVRLLARGFFGGDRSYQARTPQRRHAQRRQGHRRREFDGPGPDRW